MAYWPALHQHVVVAILFLKGKFTFTIRFFLEIFHCFNSGDWDYDDLWLKTPLNMMTCLQILNAARLKINNKRLMKSWWVKLVTLFFFFNYFQLDETLRFLHYSIYDFTLKTILDNSEGDPGAALIVETWIAGPWS